MRQQTNVSGALNSSRVVINLSFAKKKHPHTEQKKNWKIYCFCNCLLQWLPNKPGISIKVHMRINIIKIHLRRDPPKKSPTDAWYVLFSTKQNPPSHHQAQAKSLEISVPFKQHHCVSVLRWKHVQQHEIWSRVFFSSLSLYFECETCWNVISNIECFFSSFLFYWENHL